MESDIQNFREQLVAAQDELFAFIYTMIGNRHTAQDILQDTNLKLMTLMRQYDSTRPFFPWARAIAFNQIRTHLKRASRSILVFSDLLVERLAEESIAENEPPDSLYYLYLEECLATLEKSQESLIKAFYYDGFSVPRLATRFKRTENAIYVQLHRLRAILERCIKGKIQAAAKGAGPC